jgi:hypothetical protein
MEVEVPGKRLRSPAAAPQQPLHRRPPAGASRTAPGRSQASHRPLQLELFGGRLPVQGRSFPHPAPPARGLRPPGGGVPPAPPAPAAKPAWSPPPGPAALGGQGTRATPEILRAELFRRLSRLTGGRLRSLSLTDNRRTILSVRPAPRPGTPAVGAGTGRQQRPAQPQAGSQGAPIDLRIHRSFAAAPDPVLRAVAAFLGSAKGSAAARQALAAIREHFAHHRLHALHAFQPLAAGGGRRLTIDPVGAVLDLREIAGDLNQRYFDGRLKVRITWGKAAGESSSPAQSCRRSRTSSLQLGSYSYEDRLIRVHRVLDRPEVPRFVVESVVYHELLHADLPPVTRKGRRYFHTPEFRRRERQFRHFERADCWVRDNLQLLLRARRARQGR